MVGGHHIGAVRNRIVGRSGELEGELAGSGGVVHVAFAWGEGAEGAFPGAEVIDRKSRMADDGVTVLGVGDGLGRGAGFAERIAYPRQGGAEGYGGGFDAHQLALDGFHEWVEGFHLVGVAGLEHVEVALDGAVGGNGGLAFDALDGSNLAGELADGNRGVDIMRHPVPAGGEREAVFEDFALEVGFDSDGRGYGELNVGSERRGGLANGPVAERIVLGGNGLERQFVAVEIRTGSRTIHGAFADDVDGHLIRLAGEAGGDVEFVGGGIGVGGFGRHNLAVKFPTGEFIAFGGGGSEGDGRAVVNRFGRVEACGAACGAACGRSVLDGFGYNFNLAGVLGIGGGGERHQAVAEHNPCGRLAVLAVEAFGVGHFGGGHGEHVVSARDGLVDFGQAEGEGLVVVGGDGEVGEV